MRIQTEYGKMLEQNVGSGKLWIFYKMLESFQTTRALCQYSGKDEPKAIRYSAQCILERLAEIKEYDKHLYKCTLQYNRRDLEEVVKVYKELKGDEA